MSEYSYYNTAALSGGGRYSGKCVKGSPEAKAKMAYLRSLRGKTRGGKLCKCRGGSFWEKMKKRFPGKDYYLPPSWEMWREDRRKLRKIRNM